MGRGVFGIEEPLSIFSIHIENIEDIENVDVITSESPTIGAGPCQASHTGMSIGRAFRAALN
jgi:hypothetical protein